MPNIQELLSKLQNLGMATPNSTMSQAGNMDAYRQYSIQAQIQGQPVMTFEQFQQMQQPKQQIPQQGLLNNG